VPNLSIRWSELEATKEYARPFAVSFNDDAGESIAAIAVNGRELIYYRDFQVAVMRLLGETFRHPHVEDAEDPQSEWLDVIGRAIPTLETITLQPTSAFDHLAGRTVHLDVMDGDVRLASLSPAIAFEYQEAQAVIAHQSGRLLRVAGIEATLDDVARQRMWMHWIGSVLQPIEPGYEIAGWTWR
jgi:hypothetical protein